jgi:hypothetical protein
MLQDALDDLRIIDERHDAHLVMTLGTQGFGARCWMISTVELAPAPHPCSAVAAHSHAIWTVLRDCRQQTRLSCHAVLE